LTALDLITRRCSSTTQTLGLFAIEQQQQAEMIGLIRNNGGRSTIHPEPRPREMTSATSCGPTLASVDYSLAGSVSPSHSNSPEGSPYSYTQSNITSPRTPSLGSPCSVSNPSMNSVGSFQHSSPESTPHGSPALVFQPSPNYSGLLESPVGSSVGQTTYEDHIASQILNQFPEIGRILDNQ